MSENPAAEHETLKTRNWVLVGLVGVLFIILQSFFTYNMSAAVSKADKWSDKLEKVCTAQEVQNIKNELYDARLSKLESAKEDAAKVHATIDQRLNSLEERQKTTDTFMQGHK